MLAIAEENIGGAYVRRTFTNNGRQMKRGDQLTREEVLSFPRNNRLALTEGVFIEVYPKAPGDSERFMIGVGNNEYNVIEGRILNDTPLAKKEAEKLAHA